MLVVNCTFGKLFEKEQSLICLEGCKDMESNLAAKQVPKLKLLLNKYRQVKTTQYGLLQLSELASTVTEMTAFYQALETVINTLFNADNFYIVLQTPAEQLKTAYYDNPKETALFKYLEKNAWKQSLTDLVFQQCRTIHCNAEQRLALVSSGQLASHNSICRDWLGVPLSRGNQVIGVLALQIYTQEHVFDERDSQLLEFIAEYLVTAIDRVHSRELLEKNIFQRTEKLTETNKKLQSEIAERQKIEKMHHALLNISEITATDQCLENFYQALYDEVNALLTADIFYIASIEENSCDLVFSYSSASVEEAEKTQALSRMILPLINQYDEPLLINQGTVHTYSGVCQTTEMLIDCPESLNAKSWLVSPLQEQDGTYGVLVMQTNQSSGYQPIDLELIQFISQHISIAITRIRAQNKIRLANERLVNQRTEELEASNRKLRRQIEERRKAEAQLYYDAHHDTLTQLPNRAMFSDRLSYALRHLKRHVNHRFAVLFIDLDRFKLINDTLGHHAGDVFLVEIANRLSKCVRDNDILARLGGDEFVVLLDTFHSRNDVEDIAARIISAVSKPFVFDGHTLHSNASIGITFCDSYYNDANEILRDADAAMYQAKHLGRGQYVFFDKSMRDRLIETLTLEQELRLALAENQFELYYQKITQLDTGALLGYEALLRWNHPTKGVLKPNDFLSMAEESGLIVKIETWVLKTVAAKLAQWQLLNSTTNTYIAINLSGRQLVQAEQVVALLSLIDQYNISRDKLLLEFNESAFSQHSDIAVKNLRKLREAGIKLALDNYGAGISSFNFLHNYPFDYIKLDRSFISSLDHNNKNFILVKMLQELGEQFNYQLIAEGIESQSMLNKLLNVGCKIGQGYFIHQPSQLLHED